MNELSSSRRLRPTPSWFRRGFRLPWWRAAATALAFALLSAPASADIGAKEFQIIGRSLSMLSNRPAGRVTLGVVYAPDVVSSRREAEQVATALGGGLTVGALTLVPALVPVDQMAPGADGVVALFVTDGISAYQGAVFQAAAQRGVPTVSQDFACVRAGNCVLALRADRQVEILLNRSAAERSRVSFASAFRLLVSEIGE